MPSLLAPNKRSIGPVHAIDSKRPLIDWKHGKIKQPANARAVDVSKTPLTQSPFPSAIPTSFKIDSFGTVENTRVFCRPLKKASPIPWWPRPDPSSVTCLRLQIGLLDIRHSIQLPRQIAFIDLIADIFCHFCHTSHLSLPLEKISLRKKGLD